MAKVYVLSHGHQSIAHRFGSSNYDYRDIKRIFDSKEKVIEHIRTNVKVRVDILSKRGEFAEYPAIDKFEESTRLIYARTSDNFATETQYYIYKSYDVE